MARPATTLDGMDTTLPVAASCIRCSAIILAARSTRRRRSKVDVFETSLADRYSSLTKSGMTDFIDWHFHLLNLAEGTRGIHTDAMTLDSKIFVGLRSARKNPCEPTGPKCQWDGCEKVGPHRAPVGPGAEGLYLLFCLDHVKEYNKGYSYTTATSNADVARYQKEATAGSRPTWGTRVSQPTEIPIPSKVRSGSAKALNARKTAAQRQAQKADLQKRKLKVLEATAFETLGLSPEATPEEIRSRYKERLKMHHPDANQGNRNSEDELRASIDAHKILKLNGFC